MLWVVILIAIGLVVAGALWATKPPERSLGRHLVAYAGQLVLDVFSYAARAVIVVVVVLAMLAMAWSFASNKIEAAAAGVVHSAVQVPSFTWPWAGAGK